MRVSPAASPRWGPRRLWPLRALTLAVLVGLFAAVDSAHATFSFVDVSYTESHTLVFNPSNRTYRYVKDGSARSDDDEVVAVVVDRNPNAPGWDFIRFAADEAYVAQNQSEAFYAVGYAEGLLTADAIYSSFVTSMSDDGLPWMNDMINHTAGQRWLQTHVTFMRNLGNTNTSAYGVMVKSLLRQIDGLYDGYTAAVGPANATRSRDAAQPLSWMDMFLISFQTEIYRAEAAAKAIYGNSTNQTNASVTNGTERRRVSDHCSALVRFTGNDIFVGHDTWSSFNSMGNRQYKTYSFGTAYSITMSGYPASLSSIDDWYMTQSKLAVTETSLQLETHQWDHLIQPESVSEFIRVILANYLASTAPEWARVFSDLNSGTYNNQYMILDTKLAAPQLTDEVFVFGTLPPDTFWVIEQAPGLVVAADQTAFLNKQKFWPSYNIPFYDQIYNRSGYIEAERATGSLVNFTTNSRARLFKRLVGNVTDIEGMFRILRHNDWEHDDESLIPWCVTRQYGPCKQNRSSMFSIAARGDLAPPEDNGGPGEIGPYPLADLANLMDHGAIDTKVASVRNMMGKYDIGYAINGPTSQGQPNFNTTAYILANTDKNGSLGILEGVNWRGVPKYFDFPVVRFTPKLLAAPRLSDEPPTATPTGAQVRPYRDASDSDSSTAVAVGVVACVGVVAASVYAHRKWFSRTRHKLHEGEDTPLV